LPVVQPHSAHRYAGRGADLEVDLDAVDLDAADLDALDVDGAGPTRRTEFELMTEP
jgi:hypothetical protein